MRKVYKYRKINGTKKQKKKLKIINNFQDDISKIYFNNNNPKTN